MRAIIKDEPSLKPTQLKYEPVVYTNEPAQPTQTNSAQPLILATASDWVVSGSEVSRAIHDVKKEENSKSRASV